MDDPKEYTGNWGWIWKINTLPRISAFLWLVCHERILTKSLLFKCKITPDDICTLCKATQESPLHILRNCPCVQPLWLNFGLSSPSDFFSPSIVKDWIKLWSHSSLQTPSQFLLWKDVFPIICWTIWSARNKVVFEGLGFNHQQIMHCVKSLAIELHFSLPQQVDKLVKTSSFIGWTPPPFGFFKLNTDGSALGNPGIASVGDLIRDSDGRWIRGFPHSIGTTNSLVAELWGLRDGLKLAHSLCCEN